MELICKVSKGSVMDQIYVPRNREGFEIGSYVIVRALDNERAMKQQLTQERLYFYNVKAVEQIKIVLVKELIKFIDSSVNNYENIIITGSLLNKGFDFNDVDILIISEKKIKDKYLEELISNKIRIKAHIISLSGSELIEGLSSDPLYQLMLSKCIAKKRFIYRIKRKINYKIFDLHLLKSRALIYNFDVLNGNEKYKLTRNLIAILLFLKNKKITNERVDNEIVKLFGLNDIMEIKENILNKSYFLSKYRKIYNKIFNKIMKNIKS